MRKLTEEEMSQVNGGSFAGCASQVFGAWGILLGGAGVATGVATGGLAWAGLALSAGSLGFGLYDDIKACGGSNVTSTNLIDNSSRVTL